MPLVLTIAPPSEGDVIDVPLGQERAVVISGSYADEGGGAPEDLENVGVTVTVDNSRKVTASVDTGRATYTASVTLRCPSQPSVRARLSARQGVNPGNSHSGYPVSALSDVLSLTVRDASPDPAYLIVCRCVDGAGNALPGLDVEAFDSDPRSPHDRLGAPAQTDADGRVQFQFNSSDFTEVAGERFPDVYFRISSRGAALSYQLPGEPNVNGRMNNFVPRPQPPVLIHVLGVDAFVVQGPIREKWVQLKGLAGFLGRATTSEARTPNGRGNYNHFEGGSIYWTPQWGALEVHGLIGSKWAELGWEQGWLGFPVTDELPLPGTQGGRYSLFEHGIVTWEPGQNEAVAQAHHHERIYASVRAHILSRFYAIGPKGRRNHLSLRNRLQGLPPEDAAANAQARWRIAATDNDNPWLFGSWVDIAMAVEHAAGNAESGRVLQASQATLDSLMAWGTPGRADMSRFPQRWDAGIPDRVGNETDERDQFLDDGTGQYSGALPSRDLHHYARRVDRTLDALLGPAGALAYGSEQADYVNRHRRWETSMDELAGLITSRWIIGKLATSQALRDANARQANLIGNYLADNGYLIVRPMGGLSWRGATGMLPAVEWPVSRALLATTGADFSSRLDFRGAMENAGYWTQLEGPITGWQALGWTIPVLLPTVLGPLGLSFVTAAAASLAVAVGTLEAIVADQVLSPGTVAAAVAVMLHGDVFDVQEQGEVAAALLCKEAPNKPVLYRAVASGQALIANFDSYGVNHHAWLGLTGLDDDDRTVRDTFSQWFRLRQAQPDAKEPKGQGSRMLFAAGVAALVHDDAESESRLVDRLDQAIAELFRYSYFDPQLPVGIAADEAPFEFCVYFHRDYEGNPNKPYGPLDFMVASALAFFHAQRRRDAGRPVTTARFPAPLDAARFASWPAIAVPDQGCLDAMTGAGIPIEAVQGNSQPVAGAGGFALFDDPVVKRRPPPAPPVPAPAQVLLCDVTVPVSATDMGDVPTGVTLFKDHEIQIEAAGMIWAGRPLAPRNGPEGLADRADDARWPLYTGIDPAATVFCLVGRLNGYFRIGSALPRTRWRYHDARALFLRINDDGPGDGNGQFDVRIRVWGPSDADPAQVFQPPNVVRTGGLLRTVEAVDFIEVMVEPGAVGPDEVEFVLETPNNITWRKEMIIRDAPATGTGEWLMWTQDSKHRDANGLYRYQLEGATLEFKKMKFGGGVWSMVSVRGLEAAPIGARVTFKWVRD